MARSDLFELALEREQVPAAMRPWVRSIYSQESGGGRNTRTSNAGAVGGMQILRGTFNQVADPGWSINNPEQNARAGIRYYLDMVDYGKGDPRLGAIGYYGGPGAINAARRGEARSDPRNPNAPNTFQYGDQVAARVGRMTNGSAPTPSSPGAPLPNNPVNPGISPSPPPIVLPQDTPVIRPTSATAAPIGPRGPGGLLPEGPGSAWNQFTEALEGRPVMAAAAADDGFGTGSGLGDRATRETGSGLASALQSFGSLARSPQAQLRKGLGLGKGSGLGGWLGKGGKKDHAVRPFDAFDSVLGGKGHRASYRDDDNDQVG